MSRFSGISDIEVGDLKSSSFLAPETKDHNALMQVSSKQAEV
jgi:hypothetical protein